MCNGINCQAGDKCKPAKKGRGITAHTYIKERQSNLMIISICNMMQKTSILAHYVFLRKTDVLKAMWLSCLIL